MKLISIVIAYFFFSHAFAKEQSLMEKAVILFDVIKIHLFSASHRDPKKLLPALKLPPGFNITLYASGLEGARSLTLAENGVVFVGTRGAGSVYAIVPQKKDSKQDKKIIKIASGLNMPNGITYFKGDLYVAENQRILKFTDILGQLGKSKIKARVIYDQLPDKSHHGWRYLAIGPDNKLYVSIGAPCNICLNQDKRFASIIRLSLEGENVEIYARGIRNSVGFTFHPETKALWFTDNGRDWLGDNIPPDELNYANASGMHFGFPYVYGNNIPDSYYQQRPNITLTPPVYAFHAHVAALGLRFYTKTAFPKAYQGNLFVALHGSWNRTSKVGYKIKRLILKKNQVIKAEDFITGWLDKQNILGRPVDVLVMPDGSLLISDDFNGVVYQVHYLGE